MPIYAYKCDACGHAKDVLQKMSDAPLSVCPACGASTFTKQVTAAGFQLKGSGWYATDFKGGATSAPAVDKAGGGSESGAGDTKTDAKTETKSDTASAGKSESKAGDAAVSKAPAASSGGCGASCACH